MKSRVIKRTVYIDGRKTGVSIEDAFWSTLQEIAHAQGATVAQTVTEIDKLRRGGTLSGAIRLFVLDRVRSKRVGATVGEDGSP
jgi:predicted DNA-binding ribbon-helix-helix protein